MEILSSSRICKIILTILSVVLLYNVSTKAQDLQSRSHFPKPGSSFPSDFLFGAGTSALQVEGAASEGGRGPSVWDDRVNRAFIDGDKFPTMIQHYRRYKEDVQHLKNLGINSYRMSISWSRLLPGNFVYPKGLYDVLQHIKKKYQNPNIYITENGSQNDPSLVFTFITNIVISLISTKKRLFYLCWNLPSYRYCFIQHHESIERHTPNQIFGHTFKLHQSSN
ncbi:Beta-glucosidase 31 [Glycine soja]|uniref:Beta-glucosidase 31 n=1 Tax=Glycine soja TaxID=3848 RepID=A0A0B2PT59_GLYSO|nr:Beta-glucosidase 31 [Glycine soja]